MAAAAEKDAAEEVSVPAAAVPPRNCRRLLYGVECGEDSLPPDVRVGRIPSMAPQVFCQTACKGAAVESSLRAIKPSISWGGT